MEPHRVVSHDEWIAARKAHLAEEKAFTRARDALSRKRRELPWEKVDKTYVFDGADGKETLADLFDGQRTKVGCHYEGPSWEASDGSTVRKSDEKNAVKMADAPNRDKDIPWLLIKVTAVRPSISSVTDVLAAITAKAAAASMVKE